jgi:hypothetical protein
METEAETVLAIWVHVAVNETILIPFDSTADVAYYFEVTV